MARFPISRIFQRISLKKKFFLILLLTSGLSLLFACSVLVINDVLQIRDSLIKDLTDQAGLVGENSSAALMFEDSKGAREILEAFQHQPTILQAVLYTASGEALAQFRAGESPKVDQSLRQLKTEVTWTSAEIIRPIMFNNEHIGFIYLHSNLDTVKQHLKDLLLVTVVAMIVSSLFSLIISSRLQKVILGPLVSLTEVAGRISRNKDYSLRAPAHAPDEIGTLFEGFNTMLQEIEGQNSELNQHRSHLSDMVAERTAELLDTNVRLQDEIVKRERIAKQVQDMANDLKTKNEELAQSRDAALQAARTKAEFLATMSHEIRTPMNGILGMTDLLIGTDLTPNQLSLATTVQGSAEALLTLLNDILDFSKIEAGKLELEIIDFDLGATVEASLDLLSERAAKKNLELTGIIFPDVPTFLRGDPGRLRQILLNLLGNAIKFTNKGEVSVQVLLGEEHETDFELRFHIWDTGIGIAPEAKSKLFHAFSQADSSTTRKFGGTGLGLAICQQLVDLMGGEVGVESQQHEWTLFWFSVRLQKPKSHPQQEWIPRKDLQGLRLCCIDDNPTNLFVIKSFADAWGMQAFTTTDPETGYSALLDAAKNNHAFDLAIIDRNFPEQDGMHFGLRCRQNPHLAETKLMLLTSVAQRGEALDAEEAGFNAYLTKPIHKVDLHNTIATVMGFSPSTHFITSRPLVTRHTVKEAQRQSRKKILIADDHAVNQQLMVLLLERFGYPTEVVNNGKEAIHAVRTGSYALIFMDCQMPEMDGFEATRIIRQEEDQQQDSTASTVTETNPPSPSELLSHTLDIGRIPIIALTANAMAGDREKCLAAGMDDYMTKPIRQEELASALERWYPICEEESPMADPPPSQQDPFPGSTPDIITPTPSASSHSQETSEDDALIPVDLARLQEWQELGGPEFATHMIQQFVKDVHACISAIEEALDANNTDSLADAAHGLKGICANIGASQLRQIAFDLEQIGRQGKDVDSGRTMESLRTAVTDIETFLADVPPSQT